MGLTSDYIKVPDGDENKSLLERYGYTKEQFIAWAEGRDIGEPQNKPSEPIKNTTPEPQKSDEDVLNDLLD